MAKKINKIKNKNNNQTSKSAKYKMTTSLNLVQQLIEAQINLNDEQALHDQQQAID